MSLGEALDQAKKECAQALSFIQAAYQAQQSDPNSGREQINAALDIYQRLIALELPLVEPYLGLAYLAFCQDDYAKAYAILDIPQTLGIRDSNIEKVRLRFEKFEKNKIQRKMAQKSKKIRKIDGPSPSGIETIPEIVEPILMRAISQLLQKGDEGSEVTLLQLLLQSQGLRKGAPSGVFDSMTLGGVKALQKHLELPTTGMVDQATLVAFNTLIQEI